MTLQSVVFWLIVNPSVCVCGRACVLSFRLSDCALQNPIYGSLGGFWLFGYVVSLSTQPRELK